MKTNNQYLKWMIGMQLFLLLFLSFSAMGQKKLSLAQVLDSIQYNHPVAKMYDAEVRSMDAAAAGAKSWMPPEAGVGFFMTPYNTAAWKKMDDQPGMGSVMVSIQQMFPNKRKLSAESHYMQSMSAVARQDKLTSLNQLYEQAGTSYYTWMVLEKKKAVIHENEKLLEFMIRNAELRYRNGLEKISAYYKAKAALASLQSMKLMIENEVAQHRIALNTLMNRHAGTEFVVDTQYAFRDFSRFLADTALISNRSDVLSIDRQILTNQLQLESERMNLKPQFGIRLEHMEGFGGQPRQFTLMGMVRLPFVSWASRMTKANMESYKWKEAALVQQKNMLINEAGGIAAKAQTELVNMQKQLTLYEQHIIPALRNNYKTMLLSYEQNTEELFMLFDAWETLNMTQMEYLSRLQDVLLMQVELERILQIRN